MAFLWLFDQKQDPAACLDGLSHEAWLAFVMDHPEPKDAAVERWWALPAAEEAHYRDKALFLGQVQRLFAQAERLIPSYSPAQIRQGLWCLISAFELPDVLEDEAVPLALRSACIDSMVGLYAELMPLRGLATISLQYWAPFTYAFFDRPSREREDREPLRLAYFSALSAILAQPKRGSFMGALRGLSHLRHPGFEALALGAMALRPGLRKSERAYALALIRRSKEPMPAPAEVE